MAPAAIFVNLSVEYFEPLRGLGAYEPLLDVKLLAGQRGVIVFTSLVDRRSHGRELVSSNGGYSDPWANNQIEERAL